MAGTAGLTDSIWTHDQWVRERNKLKVPKGACPGAKVGDALDKFHTAANASDQEGADEAMKLDRVLGTYLAFIEEKHGAWHDRVKKQLVYFLDRYMVDVKKAIAKSTSRGHEHEHELATEIASLQSERDRILSETIGRLAQQGKSSAERLAQCRSAVDLLTARDRTLREQAVELRKQWDRALQDPESLKLATDRKDQQADRILSEDVVIVAQQKRKLMEEIPPLEQTVAQVKVTIENLKKRVAEIDTMLSRKKMALVNVRVATA